MLVDYVPTSSVSSLPDNHGSGISYLQHDDEKTQDTISHSTIQSGRGGGRNNSRGGRGGRTGGRHTGEVSHLTAVTSNDSDVSEPYFVFIAHDM